MNNTQLLMDAAKSADYEIHRILVDEEENRTIIIRCEDGLSEWNPIESDADAFRLMVDCGVGAVQSDDFAEAYYDVGAWGGVGVIEYYTDHNNDKHAATRMAIVRAAAQSQEKRS